MRQFGGFTLIEVVVTLMVLIILSAVVTPAIVTELDRMRISSARTDLDAFVTGITDFRKDVRAYPKQLSQLATAIVSGDEDSCGDSYSAAERNRWAGPYVRRVIPGTGVPIGIGTARNQLTRVGGTNALLFVAVDSVAEEDALALNALVDGDNSGTAGNVWWISLSIPEALVTLGYALPVRGC